MIIIPNLRGILGKAIVGSSYDTDAVAYINAVNAAKGSNMTTTQSDAINTFFINLKSLFAINSYTIADIALWFPIWSNASANAINMFNPSQVGTFYGGITHNSGYSKGDGLTGSYFDTGSTSQSVNASTFDYSLFCLVHIGSKFPTTNNTNTTAIGSSSLGGQAFSLQLGNYSLYRVRYVSGPSSDTTITTAVPFLTVDWYEGIHMGSTIASNNRWYGRKTRYSGWQANTKTGSNTSAMPVTATVTAFAQSVQGLVPNRNSDAGLGLYGFGRKLSMTDGDIFTDYLKVLWETCTGLIMPR
jgi:hypothetical protein